MKEPPVSSAENGMQRLADALCLKGYDLADNVGRALGDNRKPVHVAGILCPDRLIRSPHNGGFGRGRFRIFPPKRRRLWLGTIWINNILRGATDDHWLFDVNNDADMPEAERLKTELERTFGVRITIKAVGSYPVGETFDKDKG